VYHTSIVSSQYSWYSNF